MPSQVDVSSELGVPRFEERVQTIHLIAHSLHNRLAVYRACVEQYIQESIVGEVTKFRDAFESDDLELLVDARVKGCVPGYWQYLDAVYDALFARSAIVRLNELQGYATEFVDCGEIKLI